MALCSPNFIEIPNQPLSVTNPDDGCINGDRKGYCALAIPSDNLYYQWRQGNCCEFSICDENFNELGDELVSNGSFEDGDIDWSFDADWTFDGGLPGFCHSDGAANTLGQIIGLTVGRYYSLTFTIINRTVGSITPIVGGIVGSAISDNGTFTIMFGAVVTDNLVFAPSIDFDGCITFASLKEMSPCWEAVDGYYSLPSFNAGSICGIPSTSCAVIQPGILTVGIYYKITFTISGWTNGTMAVQCGTIFGTSVGANGTFTQYITADDVDFSIYMSNTFDGCATFCGIEAMCSSWTVSLVDNDGNIVCDLSSYVTATDDYLTLAYNWQDIIDACAIPFGCYKIAISDCCDDATPPKVYATNCIDFRETHLCTKVVISACGALRDDYFGNGYSFGFNWCENFILYQRLSVLRFNPTYQNDQELVIQSDGQKKLVSSQREKQKVAQFNYIDEITLDALSTQLLCTRFYIGDDTSSLTEFIAKKDNFTPTWAKDGTQKLAQLIVELTQQGTVIFNKNCGYSCP